MGRTVSSLTLMICTYRRPVFFGRCIASVATVEVPPGFALTLVVADNNPVSERDGYVGAALGQLPAGVATRYGHQPEPGYSNARNLAIELALETGSEIFAFLDDDLVLTPGWLTGQIESYRALECDAVGGAVIGIQKVRPHGTAIPVSSMANFSFERAFVEPPPVGLGLRFDPGLNLIGNEDIVFSEAAIRAGRRIVASDWPAVTDPSGSADAVIADRINRSEVAIVMARNRIVGLRKAGRPGAVALATAGSLHYLLKAGGLSLEWALYRGLGKAEKARLKEIESRKEYGKFRATLAGLTGEAIARQDVRRSE